MVISQVQTHNGANWVKTRHRSITTVGFDIRLEEEGMDSGHNLESIGYMAMSQGTGILLGLQYEAIKTPDAVTHNNYDVSFTAGFSVAPGLFSNIATFDGGDPSHMRMNGLPTTSGAQIFVEEETCSDAEIAHTTEVVDIIAVVPGVFGEAPPPPGVGEVGLVELNDVAVTVTLSQIYINPIIIAGIPTHNADHEVTIRISARTENSFNIYADESRCLDSNHALEQAAWMVIEAGMYPDAGDIQAGTVLSPANHDNGFDWVTAPLYTSMTDPIIVSQIQTHGGGNWVKTRHRNVQSDRFDVRLEEEGLDAGHNQETIGWIAFPAGTGTIGGLVYEAVSTGDVVTHNAYDQAFTASFADWPGLFGSIASFDGADPSHLRMNGLNTDSNANIFVEEETCSDAELGHTPETVHLIAVDFGAMGATTVVIPPPPPPPVRTAPVGETGTIILSHAVETIVFTGTYTNPVVFANLVRNPRESTFCSLTPL